MTINFNVEPYFDDFDKNNSFYKILFRPGYAVQTRELTQIQSILQNQIKNVGDHLFKNGTMVIPGELSIDTEFHYVKLQQVYASINVDLFISNLIGTVISGASGVQAQVIAISTSTSTDDATLFVKYISNSTDATSTTFGDDEVITSPGNTAWTCKTAVVTACGIGSAAVIKEGIYYVDGSFVLCTPQTIILEKYSSLPTCVVGFNVIESISTPELNETLLDNAQGSYNFAAPGAHRHSIVLQLTSKTSLETGIYKFIQLVALKSGVPQNVFNQTVYAELAKVFARRTYDESGDYVVKDFKVSVHENRDNNRGPWLAGETYIIGDIVSNGGHYYTALNGGLSGSTAPTTTTIITDSNDGIIVWRYTETPKFNGGVSLDGDEGSLSLAYESGKAYVKGYEIEKVASTYLTVPKARVKSDSITTSLNPVTGNYVLITNVHNLPNITAFHAVDLYNRITSLTGGVGVASGTKVGTARIRYFEYHSGGAVGTSNAVYKLGLFNIKLNPGMSFTNNVRQFFINGGNAVASFTCDINPKLSLMTGSVTSSGQSVAGLGTIFSTQPDLLKIGDYISIGGTLACVNSITDNQTLTTDTSINTASGVQFAYYKATTELLEPQNSSLIFKLPAYAISNLRDGSDNNVTTYSAYRYFSGGSCDSSGNRIYTLASLPNNEQWSSTTDNSLTNNFIGVNNNNGNVVNVTVTTQSPKQITVNYPGLNNASVSLIGLVQQTGAGNTEKVKTLVYSQIAKTTQTFAAVKNIKLGVADGYELISVKMDSGNFVVQTGQYTIDVSSRYTFDNGQTDSFYDVASITLKDGMALPTAPLLITFGYFSHSDGDYFSVDSYSSIDYRKIPTFNGINLRDCLDFRPRIDDTGTTFVSNGTNHASPSVVLKRSVSVSTSYKQYLSRKDKIVIMPEGDFTDVQGQPGVSTTFPVLNVNGMVINNVTLEPYTFVADSNSVLLESIDNRRYTMRDIGDLDRRINRLETYTAMSLLESETNSSVILDINGNNSFKTGFIVDPFTGHGVSNSIAPDYMCSIDPISRELRPAFHAKYIDLIETSSSNRTTYSVTGDIVSLPYTDVKISSQPFATVSEIINPFSNIKFQGNVKLYPEQDAWFDTGISPDVASVAQKDYRNLLSTSAISDYQFHYSTLWNIWQTDWFGINETDSNVTQDWSTTSNSSVVSITEFGQLKSDLSNILVTNNGITQNNGKNVSSDITPYINNQSISFVASGLKVNTKVYATFDSSEVTTYISTAYKMTVTYGSVGVLAATYPTYSNVFDTITKTSDIDSVPRTITNNSERSLSVGDVITGLTSGATAILLYQGKSSNAILDVVNVKGTFQTNEVIEGSISKARARILSIATQTELRTNNEGVVSGLFNFPKNTLQYRTGQREFIISDTINLTTSTTAANGLYTAIGDLDTNSAQIVSTRFPEYVYSNISANKTVSTLDTTLSENNALAQSYVANFPNGVFLTKIGLYFTSKATLSNIPVKVEIREMQNGYPTHKVLPFSRKYLYPSEITAYSIASSNATETIVKFDSPVYLSAFTEYAIVIMSDSKEYELHTGVMGQKDAVTGQFVSKQNELKTLFKPQNTSSWVSSQLQYLRMNVYRAKFATTTYGVLDVNSRNTDIINLPYNPFMMKTGSSIIRVSHPNHGFVVSSSKISKVTISGVTATTNGILSANLNGIHDVSNVDLDSYTITVTGTATIDGAFGGSTAYATDNILFDSIYPMVQSLVYTGTTLDMQIKKTTGKSVDGVEVPYIKDPSFSKIQMNDNVSYNNACVIASKDNETAFLSGSKSFNAQFLLYSTDEYVSPIIDLQRLGLTCISNRINSPVIANTQVSAIDDRTIVSANVAKISAVSSTSTTKSYIQITNSGNTYEVGQFSLVNAGRYLTLSGFATSGNNGDKLVDYIYDDGTHSRIYFNDNTPVTVEASGSTITIISKDRFIEETSPTFGSVINKYISKEIILTTVSTGITGKVQANIPSESTVELYYKTNSVGGTDPLSSKNWIKATGFVPVITNDSTSFKENAITINGIPAFDSFQIKLVMKSSNSCKVPRMRNLRIIASA